MKKVRVGILAFHGDVSEHAAALRAAASKLKLNLEIVYVRTKAELMGLNGFIISGGESTTMQKLVEREGMWQEIKKVKAIFGTCAGAILLAKKIQGKAKGQRTLGLMDIEVARNAYGRQSESFEERIQTTLGTIDAVFVRAPKILAVGKGVTVLSKGKKILAYEQKTKGKYYLATTFHPELTTSVFHEHFLTSLGRSTF